MNAQQAYEAAEKAMRDAKPKLIAYLDHRDAPEGIRKIYEKGFWEYQQSKAAKSKLAGPAYRERRNITTFFKKP